MKLLKDDKFYEIKLSTLNPEKSKALETADNFVKHVKNNRKKEPFTIIQKERKKHTETIKLKV